MNRTKQILIVGLSALALMVVLKGIGNRFSHPPKTIERVEIPTNAMVFTSNKITAEPRFYTDLQTNKDGAIHGREIQTVRMDMEPERYKKMKQAMTETLQSLGIEAKERTVQRLVSARIKADWSEVPEHFKSAPDWAALQSFRLKRAIANELKTEDPTTLKRVLETPLVKKSFDSANGTLEVQYIVETPPMADFQLRKGQNAVYDEAKAIEEANK